jgi:type I restriction enzyme S subunit
MSEPWPIPPAWRWSTMGHVAHVIGGGTPRSDRAEYFGGDVPWITPADLSGYTKKFISSGARNITQEGLSNSGARLLPPGTVLFSSRAPIGYVAIAAKPLSTNQGFKSFVLRDGMLADFVYYYLQRAKELAINLASGTTFLELSGNKAAQIPVPVAPFDEQHRIVSEIEKQFTRLETGIAALKRGQANLKRYRMAVLKAACEGRLIKADINTWRNGVLGEVLTHIEAGKSFKCEERPPTHRETGVVKISAVTWGTYDELQSKTCLDSSRVEERYLIQPDDFLFSRANTLELIGACVIAKKVTLRVMLSDKILRFHLSPEINRKWVLYWLRSPSGRHEIERLATGNQVSMRNIGQNRIREIAIKLPPLEEQSQIVEEIDRRFSVVEEIESVVHENLKRAMRLRQSILQQAFSGKLVPQNANEESVNKLFVNWETDAVNPFKSKLGTPMAIKSKPSNNKSRAILETLKMNAKSLTPEELFMLCGRDATAIEEVERFFGELRVLVDDGSVEEIRQGKTVVTLRAKS